MNDRENFEAWISAPPYEREVERFGDKTAWPGCYRESDVDLAWQAWSAATADERERCAKVCESFGADPWAVSKECADAIRKGEA